MYGIVGYNRNKQITSLTLVLITIFCAGSLFSQETSNKPINSCENYGKKGFEGEAINLNLANKDLKDILNLISEKSGCSFVVDKSVGKVELTENIDRVPWNIALDAILRSQDLIIDVKEKTLQVKKYEWWQSHSERREKDVDSVPLYTEFIKLKRLLSGTSPPACNYGSDIKEQYTGLSQVIDKMLSRRGAVETDSKSDSLIITDTKERVSLILKQIKDWDNSDLTLEEIIKDFESKNK